MPSTYSANLRLELVASGEQGNTWGNTTNNNLGSLLEQAITGATEITSLPATLTALNGASDQSRSMYLYVNAPTGGNIIAPATPKMYIVKNNTTDSTNVIIKTSSSTGITIPGGASKVVYYSAATSDFVEAVTAASAMYLSSAISADTQATTKLYVDTADTALLPRNGTRNMTGELILSSGSQPSNSLAAVSKQYVNSFDISVANTSGNTSAASGLIKAGSFSGGNLALTLAPATSTNLGGVKPNSTQFSVALDGAMTLNPPAGGLIGGVKAGTNIMIAGDGTISASGGASGVASVAVTAPIVNTGTATNVALSMAANAYYPYTGNPSNFVTSSGSVNYANSAGSAPANGGNADTVGGYSASSFVKTSGNQSITGSASSGNPSYLGITDGSSAYRTQWGVYYSSSTANYLSYYGSYAASGSPSGGRPPVVFVQWIGTSSYPFMAADNNGNVSVNSLTAGGTVSAGAGTGILTAASDQNLKVADGFIDSGLTAIEALQPRYFYWKDEEGNADPSQHRQLGFFAQEVQAIVPEASPTGLGIFDRSIIAMLVKAVQELSAEVKALKGE